MKKMIFVLFILYFLMSGIYGQTNVYAFGGIFTNLTDTTGETIRTEDVSISKHVDIVDQRCPGDIAVLAHSQGGVRALGLAAKLTREGNASRMKALVAFGSPVKGYSPLLAGREKLMGRVDKVIDKLLDGCASLTTGIPIGSLLVDVIVGKEKLKNLVFDAFLTDDALRGVLDGSIINKPGIVDLHPNSGFIEEKINNNDGIRQVIRVKVGEKIAIREYYVSIKILGLTIGRKKVSVPMIVDVYEYKIYYKPTSENAKIASSIPLGFIVGQDNNPLNVLDSATRKTVQKYLDNQKTGYEAGMTFWIGATGASIFTGPFAFLLAPVSAKNALNCKDARDIVANPAKTLGGILGSSANDCFILESDQTRPLSGLGGLGGRPIGDGGLHIAYVKANHANETKHPLIWKGTNDGDFSYGMHGDNVTWTRYSIIGTWFQPIGISQTAGTVVK